MNRPSPFTTAFLPENVAEEHLFKKITFTFGLLAILSGVTGIMGNISGVILISSVCPGCKTMALSAALIWIFFGAILVYISSGKVLGRTVSLFLRAALVVIAGTTFLEIISGLYGGHFIIESWFIAAGSVIFGPLSSPLSPVAAGFIVIAAVGLFFYGDPFFLSSQNRRAREITVVAGIIITLVSLTLILSYFYGNPFFYGTPVIPIAAISAIAAFCIGAGLIAAAGPATVPVCYFRGNSTQAMLLRNFVTLTVAVTLCENIFFYIISSWYHFSDAVTLSVSIVIFIIATALIVARISGQIGHRLDTAEQALVHQNEELSELNEELQSAEEELRQNVDDLTKTELALRESEERLIWHIDNSPLAVITFDSQFRITVWSDEATRMFGWTKEEIVGKILGEFRWVYDDDIDRVTAISSDMMSGKSPRNMHSNRNYRKDGSVIYCEWYNSALRDKDGNLISIHSQVLDVTARKKTEDALRERDWFLRETEKNAKLGGWMANPHTDYLKWTDGIYDIVEAPRNSSPGFSEGLKYFAEEDRLLVRNKLETCLSTGDPFTLELPITTGTGLKVWTELRGLMPVTEGTRSFVTGTFQNITERRQIEEKLKQESGKLNILADAARRLLGAEKPEQVVLTVGERVMQHLSCQTFFNYIIEEGRPQLHLNAYAGITREDARRLEYLDLGDGVCGRVARDGERIVSFDIPSHEPEGTFPIHSFGTTGYACYPIVYQGRTLGTLLFGTSERPHFTYDELELMQAVTDLVATAMARKKIEETLRGTSQYLENLIDYANAPIIVWDPEFRILRFNHAFEFLTGMTADTVQKKPLDILFPEKTRHETMELIKKTSRGEQWDSVEIPIRHVSGAIKIVLWNSANIYDAAGVTITSTIAQGNDITERKRAEETSIKTASLLNAALDSTADGILVVDNSGNITSYNKTFCEIWGIPVHRLDSAGEKTALAYMTPLIADSREFVARLKDFYSHPERESYDIVSLTDGRIFERYSKPQKINETIVGRVWSYRDITERRQAEEALRESLEKFRIIATNTPDHILVQDMNLRYIQVINPQLGLTVQEMIGKTDYEVLSKEDADVLTKIKKHVVESGTAVHQEIPLVNARGEKNYFAGSYVPKRNAAGEIDGLIGYFRNVTESKLANEKITAALAEKEILIREIHHRVKNNLQIISSLLYMTRTRTQDPAVNSILTDMMMKIKTMAQIHTRLYESKQFDKINMSSHIRDQVTDLSNIYRKSGPEITCTVEAEDLFLPVDQAIPCALVINEALSNAFKHAFKGRERGTILITLSLDGENVNISVEDDGVGIPVDVDTRLSTSLGLKLIRSLVLQLEGTVKIESTMHGSTVNVCFPIR
ncbi:MAG: PAS domain S-box protein [Methanoregula sp.]